MNAISKKVIIETALSMGFERAVIAALSPMEAERKVYENWLSLGYGAGMQYLHRNPEKRNNPGSLCPEAYSAILLFASYYTKVPEDPGPQFGRVASYAVGQDYHAVLPAKLAELKTRIEEKLQRPLLGKYFTDDVELYEQGLARRHGLGFTGKNSLLIGPRLAGSFHFIAELFTDIPLEADEPYVGTCGNCFRCGAACPTSAIKDGASVDSNLCISYLTIENKGAIPEPLRKKIGSWVFGCDICQEVCPYNQRPPETRFREFRPDAGAGHYLNLFDILRIADKKEFLSIFGKTALTRPKRMGLIRNALTVIGNRLPACGEQVLYQFLCNEGNPMLAEHGLWALSCYDESRPLLRKLYDNGPASWRASVAKYLVDRS